MQRGCAVQVVMTARRAGIRPAADLRRAHRPESDHRPVLRRQAPEDTLSSAIEHIGVAQDNELLVVAPATADLLAKFAHGLADDFLTTLYLAFTGPVVLAPAMNTNMWQHPATQANLETLRKRGHRIVEPDDGFLACGMVGPGRLAEPERIAERRCSRNCNPLPRSGRRDRADHRRADAGAARSGALHLQPLQRQDGLRAGAKPPLRAERDVILVSGPVQSAAARAASTRDPGADRVEMRDAVFATSGAADHHHQSRGGRRLSPAPRCREQKVKKTAARFSLELDPTPDILAELGRKKGDRLLIGFAAETENLTQEARRKLEAKNCDMVVGNLVGQDETAFESDQNEVTAGAAHAARSIALPRAFEAGNRRPHLRRDAEAAPGPARCRDMDR